jgi:hypothetical protein|tara:strand:- start:49 stop:792 length:744 start_codon:yes stop_codon:yes gene_type:complete
MAQNNQETEGSVKIKGNPYTKVWKRRDEFLLDIGFKDLIKEKELTSLKRETTIVEENDEFLHMLCTLSVQFGDIDFSIEGNARNWKTHTKEDAKLIEKCESIAFGRALSVLGYGGEMATAEEMESIDEDGKQIEKNHAMKKAKAEKARAKAKAEAEKAKAKTDEVQQQRDGAGRDTAVSFDLLSGIGIFKDRLLELGMESSAIGKLWIDEFGDRKRDELDVDELQKFFNILEDSIKVLEAKGEEATG